MRVNSLRNELPHLDNYQISAIIKDILIYNNSGELITINNSIKKSYSENPKYIKYQNYNTIEDIKDQTPNEKTLDEIFAFINQQENENEKKIKTGTQKKKKEIVSLKIA